MPNLEEHKARYVTIAAIALATVDGQMESNYLRAAAMARCAAVSRPDIILLPEAFAAGYCAHNLTPFAEASDSPYQRMMAMVSQELDCMIVYGWLQASRRGVRNVATAVDRGQVLSVHAKTSLWPDDQRPWRDERVLMDPGEGVSVIPTRFGLIATLICYENMLPANWNALVGRVDLVLSLYNCEDDPTRHNVRAANRLKIPSAWANRTGTVFLGDGRFGHNPGTAGVVNASGEIVAVSTPGVEYIMTGELNLEPTSTVSVERVSSLGYGMLR